MNLHRQILLGLFTTATIFYANPFGAAQPIGDAKKRDPLQKFNTPAQLIEVDFDKVAEGKNEIEVLAKGAIIKIFAKRADGSDPTKNSIQTLRTEVTGEAVEKLATVAGYSRRPDGSGLYREWRSDADFTCFLRAHRAGESKVKVTIIEANGKSGESKEWKITVRELKVQEKKPPADEDRGPQRLLYYEIKFHGLNVPRRDFHIPPSLADGSMVQLEYDCPADKTHDRYVETMRIEDINGDSVRFVNAVATEYPGNEGMRRRVCCYAISSKVGTTTFKITAIGPDGKPVLQRRLVAIHVGPLMKNKKSN